MPNAILRYEVFDPTEPNGEPRGDVLGVPYASGAIVMQMAEFTGVDATTRTLTVTSVASDPLTIPDSPTGAKRVLVRLWASKDRMMALAITTKPAQPVVSLEEFREQSGQDGINADDLLVARLIEAVTSWLAGSRGWLGRSLIEQTLTLTVPLGVVGYYPGSDGAICDEGMMGLVLPRPPFIAIESVAIVDAAGAATLIPPTGYSTYEGPGGLTRLSFTPDFRSPVLASGPAFLRVVYRAGYRPNPEDVEPAIRQGILMAVMRLYAGRGDPTISLESDPMMADLFRRYQVHTAL